MIKNGKLMLNLVKLRQKKGFNWVIKIDPPLGKICQNEWWPPDAPGVDELGHVWNPVFRKKKQIELKLSDNLYPLKQSLWVKICDVIICRRLALLFSFLI